MRRTTKRLKRMIAAERELFDQESDLLDRALQCGDREEAATLRKNVADRRARISRLQREVNSRKDSQGNPSWTGRSRDLQGAVRQKAGV